jgi:hypothetical protein
VASAVEESGAPPPPVIVAAVEGRTAVETAAPKHHRSRKPGLARVAQMW